MIATVVDSFCITGTTISPAQDAAVDAPCPRDGTTSELNPHLKLSRTTNVPVRGASSLPRLSEFALVPGAAYLREPARRTAPHDRGRRFYSEMTLSRPATAQHAGDRGALIRIRTGAAARFGLSHVVVVIERLDAAPAAVPHARKHSSWN
jgi:hypothetical protein